jgi:tellurite resistance protein TerC
MGPARPRAPSALEGKRGPVGGTVLALGIALVVLPGPALLVIPLGLAILALEFGWARRWLRHVRERSEALLGTSGSELREDRDP